jgi:cobalt-zinc-cadmium efflux system protein
VEPTKSNRDQQIMHGHHESHHSHAEHARGGHGHSHAPADFGRAFAIGALLNIGFVVVEATYGFLSGSMALLADAGHNLSDVLGLLMAWAGAALAKRKPTPRFTYGLRSTTILAALANAILLLVAVGAIAWEAVRRLAEPEPVAGTTMMIVAAIGIAINAVTALLFMSGRRGDINVRGAFLHMVADALVSLGVVIAGAAVLLSGWTWIDPAVSLAIAAIIVWGTWSLLHESVGLVLDGVPRTIEPETVRSYLLSRPGVARLHDLHIWSMSTTETALTCHVVMPGGHPGDAFLGAVAEELAHRFKIEHTTIQIETGDAADCALAPDHVV